MSELLNPTTRNQWTTTDAFDEKMTTLRASLLERLMHRAGLFAAFRCKQEGVVSLCVEDVENAWITMVADSKLL